MDLQNNTTICKNYGRNRDRGLIVLGVPSNSFNQEKNNNSAVKEFCEVNFNINFPCRNN